MSKNKQTYTNPASGRVEKEVVEETNVSNEEATASGVEIQETSVAEPTVEEITDVVEDAVEEVQEPLKEEVVESEQERLVRELEIKPQGVDINTGRPVYPSTPILRAMLEKQQRDNKVELKSKHDLVGQFTEKYGQHVVALPQVKYVIDTLVEYTEKMSPSNSIDEIRGGEMQSKLAKLYDSVLGYEPELSLVCLEFIVSVVKANLHMSFNERFALRFINTMRVNQEHSYRFQMLSTLFIELAKGAKGESLAEVINVRKLLDFVPDRNAKANLSEFLA